MMLPKYGERVFDKACATRKIAAPFHLQPHEASPSYRAVMIQSIAECCPGA